MSDTTYGYASRVGEWSGTIELPESARQPIPAIATVLGHLRSSLEALHRPTQLQVSWVEYAMNGEDEVAFHELDEYPLSTWDGIVEQLLRLQSSTSHRFAISCLFVKLETRILEPSGCVWKPSSAELQCSIVEPELEPADVSVSYYTYVDAWLSTTYGEGYVPRDNHEIASANRPRLEAVVGVLRALTGSTFRVGQSQLYPFAITETGFVDVDELWERRRQ